MQHLKVSGAVRPLKWSLGVKWLSNYTFHTWAGVHKACFMINAEGFFPLGKSTGAWIWLHAFIQYLYLAPKPLLHDAQIKTATAISFNQTQVRLLTLTHHNRLYI